MFFCGKRIEYLAMYDQGEKKAAAGFVRMQSEGKKVRLLLQIKTENFLSGRFPLYMVISGEIIMWTAMEIREGIGKYERLFEVCEGGFWTNGKRILVEKIENVYIEISDEVYIGVKQRSLKEKESTREEKQKASKEKRNEEKRDEEKSENEKNSSQRKDAEKSDVKEADIQIFPDKWEQLRHQYKNIHPFGDERTFISLGIQDFVILRGEYQKLVHNSFLLHGFYNYRHLILGKDCRIGDEKDIKFYLGVPGNFYEREKMVAVMFGFEGFECDGPVEIGKFGYYMRKVEI